MKNSVDAAQDWINPLVHSPWQVPHAAGQVKILIVCNVKYRIYEHLMGMQDE